MRERPAADPERRPSTASGELGTRLRDPPDGIQDGSVHPLDDCHGLLGERWSDRRAAEYDLDLLFQLFDRAQWEI